MKCLFLYTFLENSNLGSETFSRIWTLHCMETWFNSVPIYSTYIYLGDLQRYICPRSRIRKVKLHSNSFFTFAVNMSGWSASSSGCSRTGERDHCTYLTDPQPVWAPQGRVKSFAPLLCEVHGENEGTFCRRVRKAAIMSISPSVGTFVRPSACSCSACLEGFYAKVSATFFKICWDNSSLVKVCRKMSGICSKIWISVWWYGYKLPNTHVCCAVCAHYNLMTSLRSVAAAGCVLAISVYRVPR
jgi:hypothetical protein